MPASTAGEIAKGSRIRAEQVRIVYDHIGAGISATLVNVLITLVVLWEHINTSMLGAWAGYMLVVNLGRLSIVKGFHRQTVSDDACELWRRRFIYGAILAGFGWGWAALVFNPQIQGAEQTLLFVILAGMAAGATASLSAVYPAYLGFSLLTLVPLFLTTLLILANSMLALLVLLFLLFMLIAGKRYSDNISTALSLRFENEGLLHDLAQEIAQRQAMEGTLLKKEEGLENAQRIAQLGSWEWDVEEDRFYLSTQMRRLLSLDTEQEVISRSDYLACVHVGDRDRLGAVWRNALSSREGYECEYRLEGEEAHQVVQEFGEPHHRHDGKVTGLSAAVLDITQRKEVDRIKGEFISMVSHELRTPLTSINGSLGLLKGGISGQFDEKTGQLLDTAERNARRLVGLVNDILDINKLEFGDLPLHYQSLDMTEVVVAAMEESQGFVETLGVSLSLETPSQGSCLVEGDRDRLIQVLVNLLSNAAKYSPVEDVVNIRVSCDDDSVRVEVEDHGPGIPANFQNKVFEKFSQGDTSDSRFIYGTGLGLSICKLIIEKHAGQIGFDSVEGEGSCFYFVLPRRQN